MAVAVHPARGRLVVWLAVVAVLASLAYASRIAAGRPPKDVLYEYETAIGALIEYGIILGLVLWLARGFPKREFLALRRPNSWRRAGLISLAVLGAIYALTAVMEPFLHPGREQGLTPSGWDPDRAGGFVANFAVVALVAPFVEELMFRGAGFRLLEEFGTRVAIAGVGATFALVHGLFAAFPLLFAFGAGLAILRSRTRSVYPGIILHMLFNAAALIVSVSV